MLGNILIIIASLTGLVRYDPLSVLTSSEVSVSITHEIEPSIDVLINNNNTYDTIFPNYFPTYVCTDCGYERSGLPI